MSFNGHFNLSFFLFDHVMAELEIKRHFIGLFALARFVLITSYLRQVKLNDFHGCSNQYQLIQLRPNLRCCTPVLACPETE